jgi:riboflavin synthase
MTTLGGWGVGKVVNLEHAVTATTLLGGHLVQGHVDGVGEVVSVDQRDGWRVRVAAPKGVASALVPQGSVAVDGVSLTIARVEGEEFEVALIPVTLQVTTLGELRAGSKVNVEADVIAKQVARVVAAMGVVPARGPAR